MTPVIAESVMNTAGYGFGRIHDSALVGFMTSANEPDILPFMTVIHDSSSCQETLTCHTSRLLCGSFMTLRGGHEKRAPVKTGTRQKCYDDRIIRP